ncbi:hypothetical protein Mal52_47920 [Symmachiella dynata]|uniref:Uncharacterized protein n=1 Tax=Symmachiella dynata TaxID=2527995 RepID=A0A517ZUW0_9PLAN|nr:hypothetical protein Mal52_47920 [Symmachiella dynata]
MGDDAVRFSLLPLPLGEGRGEGQATLDAQDLAVQLPPPTKLGSLKSAVIVASCGLRWARG